MKCRRPKPEPWEPVRSAPTPGLEGLAHLLRQQPRGPDPYVSEKAPKPRKRGRRA